MYSIKTEASFDSAHFLGNYAGKCSNLHGHRWRIIAEICSETLLSDKQNEGMVLDFTDFKATLKSLVDDLDHAFIYEKSSLKQTTISALEDEKFRLIEVDFRPTAENFAKYFYDKLTESGFSMSKITVYETPNNSASYYI